MRLAIISSACRWPMTRWFSVSASLSTVSISFLTIRPTGCRSSPARPTRRPARPRWAGSAATRPASSVSCACSSGSSASSCCAISRRLARGRIGDRYDRRPPASAPAPRARDRLPVPSTLLVASPQRGAHREDAIDQFALALPALLELDAPRLGRRQLLGRSLLALGDVHADRLFAPDDLELGLAAPRCVRRQSSSCAGTACWLIATRAHAVSSRLTALSGSWRAGM